MAKKRRKLASEGQNSSFMCSRRGRKQRLSKITPTQPNKHAKKDASALPITRPAFHWHSHQIKARGSGSRPGLALRSRGRPAAPSEQRYQNQTPLQLYRSGDQSKTQTGRDREPSQQPLLVSVRRPGSGRDHQPQRTPDVLGCGN